MRPLGMYMKINITIKQNPSVQGRKQKESDQGIIK
jgi:hypothetical protein